MLLPAVALFAKSLTKAEADACRAQLAAEWKQAVRSSHQARWERSEAEVNGLPMLFWKAVYGEKPADGRSLWISLHGGGNTHPLANLMTPVSGFGSPLVTVVTGTTSVFMASMVLSSPTQAEITSSPPKKRSLLTSKVRR